MHRTALPAVSRRTVAHFMSTYPAHFRPNSQYNIVSTHTRLVAAELEALGNARSLIGACCVM